MLRNSPLHVGAMLGFKPARDAATRPIEGVRAVGRTIALQRDYKAAFAASTRAGQARDPNTVGSAAMARGDYATAETFVDRAMEISSDFNRVAWGYLIHLKQLTRKPIEALAARKP